MESMHGLWCQCISHPFHSPPWNGQANPSAHRLSAACRPRQRGNAEQALCSARAVGLGCTGKARALPSAKHPDQVLVVYSDYGGWDWGNYRVYPVTSHKRNKAHLGVTWRPGWCASSYGCGCGWWMCTRLHGVRTQLHETSGSSP